jgi:hypothetical protein
MAENELIPNSGEASVPSATAQPDNPPSVEEAGVQRSSRSADGGTESKKLSLREQLQEQFKAAKEPEPKEIKAKPIKSDERPRDETGKFLPKEAAAAPEKAAPVELAPKEVQPEASKPLGLPPGWSPETKAFVNSLPADHPLRKDVEKREREVSDGFKKYSDDAKKYQEIEQVLAQARPVYQQNGFRSDAEAIRHLMQWEAAVRQNPAMAIAQLARSTGVDLASLAQNPSGQSNGQDVAAQYIQPIAQQVNSLQNELARIQSEKAASEIAQFSKDKPYFERVKTSMGQLMQAGLATDLDSAYQKAIGMDPDIRAEILKTELDSKLNASQQEAQQRAQNARKAAVSPSTRAPAAPNLTAKEKPKGVRSSILAAVEEIREGSRA